MKKFLILGLIPLLLMVPGTIFADESNPEWLEDLSFKLNIPNWVKNTAGWWSEDKISDDEFLSAVSYLKNNDIISTKKPVTPSDEITEYDKTVTSVLKKEELETLIPEDDVKKNSIWHSTIEDALDNPEKIEISVSKISGTFDDNSARVPITITIFTPSGETITNKVVGSRGEYSSVIRPIENQIPGIYEIEIKADEKIIESGFLFLEGTPDKIPEWIKNNAGWWASGQIPDEDFVAGIQFLVDTNMIRPETENEESEEKLNPVLSEILDQSISTISGTNQTESPLNVLFDISEKKSQTKNYDIEVNTSGRYTADFKYNLPHLSGSVDKQSCFQKARSDDGAISALEKGFCEQENRVYFECGYIRDQKGNIIGEHDAGCVSGGGYGDYYGYYDYSGYYGSYGYSDADVQRMLDRADYYVNKMFNEIDPYAQAWVDGRMSYDEYERRGMAIMDYYSNQYVNEFNSYYP